MKFKIGGIKVLAGTIALDRGVIKNICGQRQEFKAIIS